MKTFPSIIYVQHSEEEQHGDFQCYQGLSEFYPDDTVAVYKLEKICKIKEKKELYLEDELRGN